jgi:hypothetical protein
MDRIYRIAPAPNAPQRTLTLILQSRREGRDSRMAGKEGRKELKGRKEGRK